MATSAADCDEMLDWAARAGVHLQVGHVLRYSTALQLVKDLLEKERVGPTRAVALEFSYDAPEYRRWSGDPGLAGGGALLDAGVHCLDALLFLFDRPITARRAVLAPAREEAQVEAEAVCLLEMGEIPCLMQVAARGPYYSRLAIAGSRGALTVCNFAATWGTATLRIMSPGQADEYREVQVDHLYETQLRDFVGAVLHGNNSPSSSQAAASTIRLVEQLYRL
jgi:predicted dehydrogenase